MFRPIKQYALISKYALISDMRLITRKYGNIGTCVPPSTHSVKYSFHPIVSILSYDTNVCVLALFPGNKAMKYVYSSLNTGQTAKFTADPR